MRVWRGRAGAGSPVLVTSGTMWAAFLIDDYRSADRNWVEMWSRYVTTRRARKANEREERREKHLGSFKLVYVEEARRSVHARGYNNETRG